MQGTLALQLSLWVNQSVQFDRNLEDEGVRDSDRRLALIILGVVIAIPIVYTVITIIVRQLVALFT